MEIFLSICLGISIAACCGFRIFLPLLVGNVASLLNFYNFSAGFEWMGSWTAFAIFITATAFEITAYYIPFLDNILDKLALPLAVGAGTLLSTSYLSTDLTPSIKWGLGIIAGGGAAGLIHAATGFLRIFSSAGTGGTANGVVSTAENGAALGFSAFSLALPAIAIIAVIILTFYILKKLVGRGKKSNE